MSDRLDTRSIRFPASGHIWIPAHGRRAAASGLSMHSPCHPLKVLAQRALWAGVRVAGPRLIPGERVTWQPPVPDEEWQSLLAQWRDAAGAFDGIAVYHRPQTGRTGFAALLLRAGRGVAFARLHPEAARIRREFEVVSGVHRARPRTFRVAEPIAADDGALPWMLTRSVPNYPLGPLRSARRRGAVADELGGILAGVLDRPAGVPAHWVPAHGDFTPWNVRTDLARRVYVIDWEDAGYAPPGVDALYGALTAHTTFGAPLPADAPREARDWLDALIADRAARESGSAAANAELRALLGAIPVR
ncbi:MAG TPA: phosphotransferase [Microbacterium sp.]|uniref:phosphotransferase n=1 Tax=Microbacterium sp. TaxID=51671 RepID=UPI002B49C6BD|nr:phosphotransferase [Microbacterium sp.]HKT57436.1 phosphotransferase [Microbacterium sp.]